MDAQAAETTRLNVLIERMLDDDEDRSFEAALEIGRIGPPVLPRMIELTVDPRPRMREMASCVLGGVGYVDIETGDWFYHSTSNSIRALLSRLETDPYPLVRAAAARALGSHTDPATAPALCHAASDPSADVRYGVVHALGSFFRVDWDEEGEQRYWPQIRNTLLHLIDDEDEEVRNWATFGLGWEGHDTPAVRARLWKALDDPYIEVRAEAASALAGFGDHSFAPRLEHLLLDDPYFHDSFFEAAEELGDPALLPAVEDAAERWKAKLEEGEELSIFVTGAIEALRKAAEARAKG